LLHVTARAWLLVSALALTGLSMRTAVTSVGAVLDDIEAGLHTSSGISGVLTTLPVICFAGLGALTPRLAGRFGAHRVLVASLVAATLGTLARAVSATPWAFLVLSLLALTGGAISNVVLPSLVKAHFPERIGQMTAVYTTALAVGTTAGAGLTVPIGELGGGWRFGIGSWALFDAIAVVPWLWTLRHDGPAGAGTLRIRPRELARSRTAWILTAFFGMQSMQAYITFGWFARFLHEHGISSSTAGWMVALLSALGIPTSVIAPNVPVRHHRLLVNVLALCFVGAYIGLGVAPVGGAWVWMVLSGIGNGMFPLALTMIGLRSRSPQTTAALSAFVQAIGYIVAGTGPLLFGVLFGATGSWALPLTLLWVSLGLAWIAGLLACSHRYVDDEIPTPLVTASPLG
jgi:CP family cyanate transporter-like MFS transporter